ncbi:MAG: hypothetical protein JSW71_14030 [Gemmatimonadota bacterium]|nr:MAG: hypothetical protein JSW71_14030 [Gemmatimonadota bacterium]
MAETWLAIKADYVELHNMRGRSDAGIMSYLAQEDAVVRTHVGQGDHHYELAKGLHVYVLGDMVHIPIEKAEPKVTVSDHTI